GRVLRKKILRGLFEEGTYKIYDLLGAREDWKTEWTSDTHTLLHIHIYTRKPLAIFSYALASSLERTKNILRRHPGIYLAIKKIYLRVKS
ncbi:MAG: hypothetical protein P8Z75_15745, partial [Gammaproteobacteria bacterium]